MIVDDGLTGAFPIPRRSPSNFVNPSVEVNAGIWTLFSTASVFLGLRIWCKISRRHGLWWDDYILLASWLVLMITCTVISVEFATGYVTKTWDDRMNILVSISSVLTTIGQAWSKSAFAVTLLRRGITNGWQRWVLWFIIGSLNIYLTITFFLQWTNYCGHKAYWWKMPGVCVDYDTISKIKSGRNIYNVMMDFVLALFPWLVTWELRIKRIEKIGICVTMSLGVVVAIISAWRTVYMASPRLNDYDTWYFWRQGMSMIWFQSEVAGTIIVQTLPVIRHLVCGTPAQRTLVDVKLNEISTTMNSQMWDTLESTSSSYRGAAGRGDEDGAEVRLKDLESGLSSGEGDHMLPDPKPSSLGIHLKPPRESWSTFSAGTGDKST